MVRPQTKTSDACLCFTLFLKLPDQKPWKRSVSARDPSRGVVLDLQEDCEWRMPSTVMLPSIDTAASLEDSMQVQCLPVFGSDHPKWTYRKLPKVAEFRNFGRIPPWCRRPHKMTYHLCAEDITKTAIVPTHIMKTAWFFQLGPLRDQMLRVLREREVDAPDSAR